MGHKKKRKKKKGHTQPLFVLPHHSKEFLHLAKNTEQMLSQLASSEILRKTKVISNSSLT
jgi:hypothetical protein